MKYNCFGDLIALCKLSLTISTTTEKNKLDIIQKSTQIKNTCIKNAQKQFVTPIDREDVVRLAIMLHKTNVEIFSLCEYDFLCRQTDFFILINEGCNLINKCVANKLVIELDTVLKKRDELYTAFLKESEKHSHESTINTKALIKNSLFDKIEKCIENILSVIDEIIFISIKNS
ncbi:MAG: hypothetical protein IKU45_05160 [Clostridia bacterium]|nr:hypothetical protein [Clostridia bacterium]